MKKKLLAIASAALMSLTICSTISMDLPIYTVAEETIDFEEYIKNIDKLIKAPYVDFSGNQAFVKFDVMVQTEGCIIEPDKMKWEVSGTAKTVFECNTLFRSKSYERNDCGSYCMITADSPGTVIVKGTEINGFTNKPIITLYWNLNVGEDGNFDSTVTYDEPVEMPTYPTDPTEPDRWYESQYWLSINSLPDTTVYNTGDELDLTGLEVSLMLYDQRGERHGIYNDVSPLDHPDVFIVDTSEVDRSKAGTYNVKVYCTDEYQAFLGTNVESFDVIVSSGISGDVNNDGVFSVDDIKLFQKWLLTIPDTNLVNWKTADFYEDGRLDVFDLCLMKRELLNKNEYYDCQYPQSIQQD